MGQRCPRLIDASTLVIAAFNRRRCETRKELAFLGGPSHGLLSCFLSSGFPCFHPEEHAARFVDGTIVAIVHRLPSATLARQRFSDADGRHLLSPRVPFFPCTSVLHSLQGLLAILECRC